MQSLHSDAPVEMTTELADSIAASRSGYQTMVVLIGSMSCGASKMPGVHDAVKSIVAEFRSYARTRGEGFSAVGVAMDVNHKSGREFLRPFGPFDQIMIGGGWLNQAVVTYVVRDHPARLAIPQVLVVRRHIGSTQRELDVAADSIVLRLV